EHTADPEEPAPDQRSGPGSSPPDEERAQPPADRGAGGERRKAHPPEIGGDRDDQARDHRTSTNVIIPASACSSTGQCIIHSPGSSGTNPTSTVSLPWTNTVSRKCGSSTGWPLRERSLKNEPWRCIGCRRKESLTKRSLENSPSGSRSIWCGAPCAA